MKVETRILRILHESELVDIRKFKFNMDFRKDLQIDSLNLTVIMTEIEHEFTTVFEDRIFEGVQRMEELVYLICRDEKAFWLIGIVFEIFLYRWKRLMMRLSRTSRRRLLWSSLDLITYRNQIYWRRNITEITEEDDAKFEQDIRVVIKTVVITDTVNE